MESDFGYKLNLLLAMVRQNVGIVGVTIGGELFDLPLLAGDTLTGSLGVDDALECFERLCRVCPAECKLAAAQIDAAGVQAFGVDSESSDAADIINASGSAVGSLFTGLAAFFTAKNTTTTNTNATNSTTSTSSASASLGIYAGLSLGAAAVIALLIMNRK